MIFKLIVLLILPAMAFAKGTDTIKAERYSPYKELIFERVVDGDTFIASNQRIRLWGINAPEKNQPLYKDSSLVLQLFLETGRLECKQVDIDKYKRAVMHCYSDDSDVGALMVKTGFAKDFPKYSGGFYSREQDFAKEGKLGIWE